MDNIRVQQFVQGLTQCSTVTDFGSGKFKAVQIACNFS